MIAEKGNNRIGDLHNANDKVTQADLTGDRKSNGHNVDLKTQSVYREDIT